MDGRDESEQTRHGPDADPRGSCPIVLVNPPMSGVERPPLGLGLLKAILGRAGMASTILFANMSFLEYFGLDAYALIDRFRPEEAVVDWLFGAAAFPDFAPDHDAFLTMVLAAHALDVDRHRRLLLDLRREMPEFVDVAARRVLARRPRIVGCTSVFQQHVAALALLRRVRELDPSVVTVLGGANCESIMGRTTHRAFPWVDFVVSGEADDIVAPLFRRILDGGRDIPAEDLPNGVFGPSHRRSGYPDSPGSADGVPRAMVDDIRALPLPDYGEYFAELANSLYAANIRPGLPMEFSRGCWWGARSHCTFCGLNGGSMAFRARDPADVARDMSTMAARHGVERIEAVDNIMDLRYFETVIPSLAARAEPLSIFFETKSNLRRSQVKALRDAGIHWIQPGIESLHDAVLKLIGKGATAWNNLLLLKWGRRHGVRMSWNLIYGFPGERDEWYESMASWVPLISHFQPGTTTPLRFDRYSPYFNQQARHGLRLVPRAAYRHAYPLAPADLADQVYFFDDEARPDNWRSPLARPGLAALRARMKDWMGLWETDHPPTLSMRRAQDGFVIEDTRPVAVARDSRVSGLAATVLEQADDGAVEATLAAGLGRPADAVADAVAELVDRRLMVRLDRRLIALPLPPSPPPLQTLDRFPGGFLSTREDRILNLIGAR